MSLWGFVCVLIPMKLQFVYLL